MFKVRQDRLELERKIRAEERKKADAFYTDELDKQRKLFQQNKDQAEAEIEESYKKKIAQLKKTHQRELQQVSEEYEQKINDAITTFKKDEKELKKVYAVERDAVEETHSIEIKNLKSRLAEAATYITLLEKRLFNNKKAWSKYKRFVFDLYRASDLLQGMKYNEMQRHADDYAHASKFQDTVEKAYVNIKRQGATIEKLLDIEDAEELSNIKEELEYIEKTNDFDNNPVLDKVFNKKHKK